MASVPQSSAALPLHSGFSATIRIEPPRGLLELRLREVWAYRELLYFFVWRDVKIRYKQTAIGVRQRDCRIPFFILPRSFPGLIFPTLCK